MVKCEPRSRPAVKLSSAHDWLAHVCIWARVCLVRSVLRAHSETYADPRSCWIHPALFGFLLSRCAHTHTLPLTHHYTNSTPHYTTSKHHYTPPHTTTPPPHTTTHLYTTSTRLHTPLHHLHTPPHTTTQTETDQVIQHKQRVSEAQRRMHSLTPGPVRGLQARAPPLHTTPLRSSALQLR